MGALGLLTRNFRLYHDIIQLCKARSIPLLSLSFDQQIPGFVDVVLTTETEVPLLSFSNVVAVDPFSPEEGLLVALCRQSGKSIYETIIIGVDPGKRPGLAVLGDGIVLEATVEPDLRYLITKVANVVTTHPYRNIVIRLGDGDPLRRDKILNALLELGIRLELCDETSTTKPGGHGESAALIARQQGELVVHYREPKPGPGELKDVKGLSRAQTAGKIALPDDLAARVASGELGMEEALRMHSAQGRQVL